MLQLIQKRDLENWAGWDARLSSLDTAYDTGHLRTGDFKHK